MTQGEWVLLVDESDPLPATFQEFRGLPDVEQVAALVATCRRWPDGGGGWPAGGGAGVGVRVGA